MVETLHATSLKLNHATSLPPGGPSDENEKYGDTKNNQMSNISPKSGTVSTIIRSYKSALTKDAHRLDLHFAWQSLYYDHMIRNDKSFRTISQYIIENPLKWDKDKFNPTNTSSVN